ncbi:hypothetical protein DM860_014187 [Cuscuta australis]|uniref:DUF7903 domain-containing protein n=1 Tax=Cuscuta australis TaxID=267555 RepID=A0A328DDV6_9ASTE|nr:hypothetical protein DM860_014187 [Cuscuta australis]
MAYIPPHKRHSSCTPAPESHLLPRFRTNSSGRNSSGRSTQKVKGSKIVYADTAISMWFAIGLLNTVNEAESSSKFSTLIGFEPVFSDSLARKSGETPFALVVRGIVLYHACSLFEPRIETEVYCTRNCVSRIA